MNEILEDFDKILNKPLSKADELYYLTYKLRIIKEYDKELLIEEINRLSDVLAHDLNESINIEEIDSENPANQTMSENINTAVDFITINYLNLFQLNNGL